MNWLPLRKYNILAVELQVDEVASKFTLLTRSGPTNNESKMKELSDLHTSVLFCSICVDKGKTGPNRPLLRLELPRRPHQVPTEIKEEAPRLIENPTHSLCCQPIRILSPIGTS